MRELDHLAELFESVRHVAFFHDGPSPDHVIQYRNPRVAVVPVRASGGQGIVAKVGVLRAFAEYAAVINKELAEADVVHVRCPASISMLACAMLALRKAPHKRWIKYAGSWGPREAEPWSYRVQRRMLDTPFLRSHVTVNGSEGTGGHVVEFFNPCLTQAELEQGRTAMDRKPPPNPLNLLFVGRLEEAKGVSTILDVVRTLHDGGLAIALELVGDGEARTEYEARARQLGLEAVVRFRGWLPRDALGEFYAKSHLLLLPSATEGWPKVISEGMAFGVVPIASDVGSIPELLRRFGVGHALPRGNKSLMVSEIRRYAQSPDDLSAAQFRAIEAARHFSYEHYQSAVRRLLGL